MEEDLNFFKNGRRPQYFQNWKTSSTFLKMKKTSIYSKWRTTAKPKHILGLAKLSKILSIINKEVWGQWCDIYISYCVLTFVVFCFRFGVGSSGFGLVLLFIHILKNKLLNSHKFDCNTILSFPLWYAKMGLGLNGQHCKFLSSPQP